MPGNIQSIERAATILRLLSGRNRVLGVVDIAGEMGLPKGTVHGLLRTLQSVGFVEQDEDSGKYRLGAALLHMGSSYLDGNELRTRALNWSDSLATRTGEAVRIGTLHEQHVLVVHHVFRPDNTVQILEVGAAIPWHACALGKAIAAYAPAPHRTALLVGELRPLTGRTISDPTRLRADLEEVADVGYAIEDEEAIVGEAEIAAPAFDHRRAPAGAISIVGPVERLMPDGPASSLVAAVKEAARGLSRDMGAGRVAARG